MWSAHHGNFQSATCAEKGPLNLHSRERAAKYYTLSFSTKAVFSPGRLTSWTFFLGVCLQTKFKLLTQKIQITKARNFEKMAGDETFLMTSLVLILAIFLRRRRRFFHRMRLMFRQMERMRWIVLIRTIQQQNTCYRSKAGIAGSAYRHHEIGKVLAEELGDLMTPEEL